MYGTADGLKPCCYFLGYLFACEEDRGERAVGSRFRACEDGIRIDADDLRDSDDMVVYKISKVRENSEINWTTYCLLSFSS